MVQSVNDKRVSIVNIPCVDSWILPSRTQPSRQFDLTLVWQEAKEDICLIVQNPPENNALSSRRRSSNDGMLSVRHDASS